MDYSYDSLFALLLVLATNIKKIHLDTSTSVNLLPICRTVLGLVWHSYHEDPAECPFNKLEDVCIAQEKGRYGGIPSRKFDVSVPQSVRHLRLPGCRLGSLTSRHARTLALESLELQNAVITAMDFAQSLKSSKFTNLHRLNLASIQNPIDDDPYAILWFGGYFNYNILAAVLSQYTPLLEVLEVRARDNSKYPTSMWPPQLGSLVRLTRLYTLRVDIDLLIFADGAENHELFNPYQMFPPSLEHLEITRLPSKRINAYCVDLEGVKRWPSGVQFIVDTAHFCAVEVVPSRHLHS
jgi:hypothetical protein